MTRPFVHLHCHSEFSLLESPIRIKKLIKSVQDMNMPAVALTDNGSLYGAIDFYIQMREQGLNPILGAEVFITSDHQSKDRSFHSLLLLAKTYKGYQNLIKLISIGHLDGFYYRPRIDWAILSAHCEDLIAISPLSRGPIAELIRANTPDDAEKLARNYQALFKGDFYLGLERLGNPLENVLNESSVSIAKAIGCGYVASNNVYYLEKDDYFLKGVLGCIQRGRRIEEDTRFNLQSKEMYLKSPEEMNVLFQDLPEALDATCEIAKQCSVDIKTDQVRLPKFDCPNNLSPEAYLEELVWKGIETKYGKRTDALAERVDYELSIINKMHYARYFLIIFDFLDFCRCQQIPVGPGRGSAAGSIVAYALNITDIDPIEYNLLFERFLNPERVSMPDIDLDFCIKRRTEVIDYIIEKYGGDKVSQIITFGTMAARGVVRDVGRVLGVPLDEVDYVAKLIPSSPGHYVSIPQALEDVPELKKLANSSKDIEQLLDIGAKLEGQTRHTSTHAAGVVISFDPLTDVVPLVKNEGQIVTQFPMMDLEKIGLLKMDILGLRNLTVMQTALELIEKEQGVELDLETLSLDDPATYSLLCSGEAIGIFQLESQGMRQLIKDLQPSVFEDIIALLALYRPGPLGSGMVSDFISNKHGKTDVQYDLPQLEPILNETYGLIIYQEQVMQIASVVGGFSLGQADMLRRAMGKKKKEVMDKMREEFLDGAETQSIHTGTAKKIFELCYKFAEYGFNKSHSAAYAKISYQTAFLKANYPTEYMTALLSSVFTFSDKVALYSSECAKMGISILPPHVNHSDVNFSIEMHNEKPAIRFGLAAIKNVGEGAVDNIILEREEAPYRSLSDFCQRVDLKQVNKRVVESLIRCGAMDMIGSRSHLLQVVDKVLEHAQILAREKKNGQVSLFGGDNTQRFGVLDEEESDQEFEEFSDIQKLAMEKELLGLFITGHPLDSYQDKLANQTHTIKMLTAEHVGQEVNLLGLVTHTRKTVTKTKKEMKIGTLEDLGGSLTIMMFAKGEEEPIPDSFEDDHIVMVSGRVRVNNDEVSIIAESMDLMSSVDQQKRVVIDIENLNSSNMLTTIREYLSNNRGSLPVYFKLDDDLVMAHKRFWLKDDPFCMTQLTSIVGEGHIWLS